IFNIVTISVAASFTHVFENTTWVTLLLLSFLIISILLTDFNFRILKSIIFIFCLLIVDFGIVWFNNSWHYQHSKTQRLAAAGFHREALENYEQLHAYLHADPWFLYGYGRYMLQLN